ncbi:hypothetical protein ACOSQ4_002883 [Xanthoceras sorbifolium]
MEKEACKAHVLVLPYPAQGHINPMLQFAKRLVSKGIKSTLAITIYQSKSIHLDPGSSIAIQTFSDGYDEGGFEQAESSETYLETLNVVGPQTLEKLIRKLDDIGQPVTAIVYDGFLNWGLDVAKKFGVTGVTFFTQSAAVNNIYYHVNRGLLRLPLSGPSVSIPGLPLLEALETPSFVHDFGSYPGFSSVVMNQFSNIDQADWVLLDTFYKLEEKVVDWMGNLWKLRTMGPTLPAMYLDKRLEDDKDYGTNIFKPETSVSMSWLNDRPSGSVVYVAFGSAVTLNPEQMEELALGLKGSKCHFLWVVRESEETKLPNKFIEETSDQGLVVSWCPQLEVLAHESVWCSLCLGIAMVAMPQWTDQTTNAKYVEDVWGTGIRALPDEKSVVRRQVVEKCIKEVMEGEKSKEIKENTKKWKNLATEAIDEGGSSDENINEFVTKLLCS